jgi:DNA repair protein RecN (Recombination protein N)
MLTIQYLVSEKTAMPTVLFDEIDTGVSGEVAQKIGLLLKKMGANFQLIAISHLPQVVGKAQNHIKVEKNALQDRTVSKLRYLNEEERVEEVARLMSGATINDAAKESAKNLMAEE